MMSQLEQWRAAVAASPDNVPLLLLYAQACLEELAFEEARAAYERAMTVKPDDLQAKLGMSQLLYAMGKLSEASVRAEAITKARPDFAAAWLLRARLAVSEGDRAEARSHYERALELDGMLRDEALERELGAGSGAPGPDQKRVPLRSSAWGSQAEREDDGTASDFVELERPSTRFTDVGGMERVKDEIRLKIVYPLQRPEMFKAYGKKPGGGVLLFGPPGCGKTLISRATAGEIKAQFIAIGIHEVLDMWLGASEKHLHEVFELARRGAPTILFFDEIDALAASRADLRHSAGRTLVNQFLAELDGTVAHNEGILVLGATNAPWQIDAAFHRPGRFDRVIFVPPPDELARATILEVLVRDKPLSRLDAAAVARATQEFSGADLKAVVELAIERALAKAMERNQMVPVTTQDVLAAAKGLKPSTRAWFETAKNYALYSNQSGLYDEILSYLGLKR